MGTRPQAELVVVETASEETDADAIRRSAVDPDAFVVVFDRHFDTIHRYLHRRLGRDLADELAAEVFTQAYRRRASYLPRSDTALPWLYGIAANLVRRHRRTEVRRLRAYAKSGVDAYAELDESRVVDRADAERYGSVLARELGALSAGDRETLTLVAFADLTYEEAGQALGIPTGTVASRMNRIRRRLSSRLPDHVPTEEAS
jgi:RNA polymerase sigma-70 factor (ECF subfamily)